jgi:signal transduction histidine kinase/CheY-like chemotaxis protein
MRFAVIALLFGALYLLVPNYAHAARAPLVLVLNSYHPQYGWTEELVRGVRDDLAALPPENLHIEFMDARRMVDDAKYLDLLAAVYQHKYGRLRPDVIISSDDSALTFLLDRRDTLFPGVPIVFCGINSRAPEELEVVPNMTGILEGLDVAGNLTLIERLQPNARRVVLLADRTSLGQGMVQIARGVVDRRPRSALEIEIWDDFTLEELGNRVASVDEHTVFLMLAIHEDRAGRYFSFDEDLKPLTLRSRAPIYAMFSMLLGQGVIGGMMNDPYQHGRATAAVARRILAGTPADAIPVVPTAEYLPRFDYPVLRRFHVDEARLPPGSVVVRRPVSFYAQHTRLVWTTGAVFLVLVITIAWLSHLISRMRRAERELLANQAELRRAQQFKVIGSLAGGIAHDFNNLITAISGFTSLAVERVPPGDEILLDNLDQVARASQRAAGLTRQLLSFARRQPIEPRVVDLNAIIKDSQKLLRRLLSEGVELVVLPAPEVACVFADPGQLEQVLSNLATNARDAMPTGGKLTFALSVGPSGVVLRATDTGIGMSEEVKARVFEPFFTTKQVGHGTGLGLATSFSIIQQAQGSIEIDSTPGRGTTFVIRLPRVLAPPEQVDVPARSSARPVSSGVVLLVEDDPQVRRLAVRALERQGFQVLEAENGTVALELARHAPLLSCVVTDVVMPIMGGVELVRQLRSFNAHVPVIVMSGYVDDASLFEDANELDVRFVPKPFLPADLVASVCDAIRSPTPPQEHRPSL